MDASSRVDSARYFGWGQSGIIGLCTTCDKTRDVEAALAHARWQELREAYRPERLDQEILTAEQIGVRHIALNLGWARALRAGWTAVEFEDSAREEALGDLAGVGG